MTVPMTHHALARVPSNPRVHVLHENPEWLPPFARAFERRGETFEDWNLVERAVDLAEPPPAGVFYNRMSASSHTRGHRFSPELTSVVLAWLESHGRRVVNSSRALALEVNKSAQYGALQAAGVPVPRTIAAVGRQQLLEAIGAFAPGPVIVKPNRGGKGLGVRLFEDLDALRELVIGGEVGADSIDGVTLVQEYLRTADGTITRAEFIGGRFHYAVKVDTSNGFELCPADVCQIDDAPPAFRIVETIDPRLCSLIQHFLSSNGIEMAGVEFATSPSGAFHVYDVNTNTNYNPDAEAVAGRDAPQALVDFLLSERDRIYARAKAA